MQKLGEVTSTLIVRIDEETKERFRKVCNGEMSATVRSLIEKFLETSGGKIARRTARNK